MTGEDEIYPEEIRYDRASRTLVVLFSDTVEREYTAEYLRVESPSAEVKGHSASQRQWIGGKKDVGITGIEPVGNYAIRILFDDGHDTGIFSWDYLLELDRERDRLWSTYLEKIAERGLTREGR
ncbi:MAG: DUF971 domain-containing protein [Alphaproteobacteria bacterium]|nr:DUF971 domain-containing protein [Alphaproteobacteria bacterium]MDX5368608.1 DUF971 domain-containing protein [Alphaproteobacteria bacterium]MDX5463353.1 DUF971 domain-containing protein [Alphaproteobacteria bacterium]